MIVVVLCAYMNEDDVGEDDGAVKGRSVGTY